MDMVSTLGHVAKHMTAEDKSFVLGEYWEHAHTGNLLRIS